MCKKIKNEEGAHFFVRATIFNFIGLIVKFGSTFLWGYLDRPQILGLFALANVPSSIVQHAAVAGSLAQPKIAGRSVEEEGTLLRTAFVLDSGLMAFVALISAGYFVYLRSDILVNLGLFGLMVSCAGALAELVPSLAIVSSISRQRTLWTFGLSNARPIAGLAALVIILLGNLTHSNWGWVLWVAGSVSSFALAIIYFLRGKYSPFGALCQEFITDFKLGFLRLVQFRASMLLFGGFSSFYLASLSDTQRAGIFSFAFTLSSVVYLVAAPVVQQVFLPVIAESMNRGDPANQILAKISRAVLVTVATSLGVGLLVSNFAESLLIYGGKTNMLESINLLGPLILYQIVLASGIALTNVVFFMGRYRELAAFYLVPVLLAGLWIRYAPDDKVIWAFPVLSISLNGIVWIYFLSKGKALLSSRSSVYSEN